MSDYDEIIALRAELEDIRGIVGGSAIKLDKDKKATTQAREDLDELKGFKKRFAEDLDALKQRIEEINSGLIEVKGQVAQGLVAVDSDTIAASGAIDDLTAQLTATNNELTSVIEEKSKKKIK